jgi:ankyrin repeat protein
MANTDKTPYDILGVPEDMSYVELRRVYWTKIHEHKQNKISPINFRRICRAYETVSDFDKRGRYDSHKEWISDVPIDKYTLQQLAAEPDLLRCLKIQIENAHLDKINAQDPGTSHTALYCAARAGNVEAVKLLIERGAESDISQRTKSTALHAASYFGHADVVRYLLESGADYRIANNHNSTAEEEAYDNHVKEVFVELKQNPYVRVAANELEWFHENPLTEHIDTEYFAQRQTLLHCASKKGYFDMVRWLVEEHSANVDLVDFNGNSPLHLAVYGGHLDIVEYLLNRGCNPHFRNRWGTTAEEEGIKHGRWIADLFQSMRQRDIFEMAKTGIDWWFYYYFDVQSKDMIDSNGVSLLYHACRCGQYSVAKWLLEQGANVNIQMTTKSKSTPLHGAKYYGHLSIVELLLEYQADVNIKNDFNTTAFDEKFSSDVDKDLANKIDELLRQYKHNLKSEKLLDIHVYEDDDDGQEPIAKIQLEMKADYNDLLAALYGVSGNQYPYFSVARRGLVFNKEDPTVISAVCQARYASSKFIDTPICLIRHKTEPKKNENQQVIRQETKIDLRLLTRQSKKTLFTLNAPLTEKKTINIGDLRFTFSENCITKNIQFEVTSCFLPDSATFDLSGCICFFQTRIYPDTSNLVELPSVSLANEPDARLYTLATSTAYWFTSHTRTTRLPMTGGVHAFIHHVDIIPNVLSLPADMFIAAALGQSLIARDHPVPCTYLHLRDRNTNTFPLIAYHGTNINAIRSILLDSLVLPGTVVSNGKRIQPPSNHFARDKTYFGVNDFAAAIFLSPSIYYSSDPTYATPFSDGDRQLIPVLECSVKRGSYDVYPGTVGGYTAQPGDDMQALEWRVKDPASIEINGVLFITKIDSIAAAKMVRMKKITSSD